MKLIIDTSAAVAIMTGEREGGRMIEHLDAASIRQMSVASYVELAIVLEAKFGPIGVTLADRFVRDAGIEVVSVDAEQGQRAAVAWRRFGKGRHPAGLNFGDCFVYGLAETNEAKILCVGNDFVHTDITVAR